jgi:hypothetical protein
MQGRSKTLIARSIAQGRWVIEVGRVSASPHPPGIPRHPGRSVQLGDGYQVATCTPHARSRYVSDVRRWIASEHGTNRVEATSYVLNKLADPADSPEA